MSKSEDKLTRSIPELEIKLVFLVKLGHLFN